MRKVLVCFAAILLCSPLSASIADRCAVESENSLIEAAWRWVKKELVPMQYFEDSREIAITIETSRQAFYPYVIEEGGARQVVISQKFVSIACSLAFATYFLIEKRAEFPRSVLDKAATCADSGKSRASCVQEFGRLLIQEVAQYDSDPDHDYELAESIFRTAFLQVLLHELGHHLLGHLDGVSSGILSRSSAEFQADFFAMQVGVQAGHPATASYYILNPLSMFESVAGVPEKGIYESALCRKRNYELLIASIGIIPGLLKASVDEEVGPAGRFPPDMMGVVVEELFSRDEFGSPLALVSAHGCGSVDAAWLADLACEVRAVSLVALERYDGQIAALGTLDEKIELAFLGDLAKLAVELDYLGGFASKLIARSVRLLNFSGQTPSFEMADQLEQLLDDRGVFDQLLSADRSRILLIVGLNVLQYRTDLAIEERLAQGANLLERAVHFNEDLNEAWTNLAFVALRRGQCDRALYYLSRSFLTSGNEKSKRFVGQAFQLLSDFIEGGGACDQFELVNRPFYQGW